jgi:F-type H+-transporting ATPase subunit a
MKLRLPFFAFVAMALAPLRAFAEEGLPEAVIAHGDRWQPWYTSLITVGVVFLLAVAGLSRLKAIPGFIQNAWEFAYEWLEEITLQVIGPQGPDLMPFFFSVFIYILFANLLGLIPYMASPTAKIDTTLALAICTFVATHYLGVRKKGFFGYFGHFFHVVDASKETGVGWFITCILQYLLLPLIEGIGELARPLSLTLRLFGNIFAKEMLLGILAFLVVKFYHDGGAIKMAVLTMPFGLRAAVLILGVLVSLIQAVVFTALSMIYIGGAVAVHEEHDGHAAENEHGEGHRAHA